MGRSTERNIHDTDVKFVDVNEENKQLFNDYMDYCKSEDKSPATCVVYESNLKIFFVWMLEYAKNKSIIDLSKRDVMQFQNWMINSMNLSPARVRNLRASISSMSNFICDILDVEYPNFRNIISKIKPPANQNVREKTVLTAEQVDRLLKTLVEQGKFQQACLVACLAASGVRKGEIVQFKTTFFNEEVLCDGMYSTPVIRCKGSGRRGKLLVKFIIKDIAQPYYDLWMTEREKLGVDIDNLFVVKHGDKWFPAKISTVDGWMNYFTKILGVVCYSHCFRHYSATWLKRNNADINQIKDFLGHNDISTSQIYIDITAGENLKGMLNFMNK